jgi:histone H1/5
VKYLCFSQDIIKEAILSLKERSGSSPAAIKKYIGQKYPTLPAGWEKVTALQLKRLTAAGKLLKVSLPLGLICSNSRGVLIAFCKFMLC